MGLCFAVDEASRAESRVVPANRRGLWFAMDSPPSPTVKHATAWGVTCGAGAALFWALGFVAARQGVTVGPVAAGSGAASLRLAGSRAHSGHRGQRLWRSRRHGLAARYRHYSLRRPAARAVELLWLRLRAARPWRHHPAVLRRAWRPRSGAPHRQGAAAAAAHRRRAGDARRSCGDRRRGAAHHGRAGPCSAT